MHERLTEALERLDAEQAFRLLYAAYEYLASEACAGVDSGTRRLLARLRGGDAEALSCCLAKWEEEQKEAHGALEGRHRHADQTSRQTMLNELQQWIYWAILPAVAQGGTFDDMIREAWLPSSAPGREQLSGLNRLAGTLNGAATLVHHYNLRYPADRIDVREVALADLRQMVQKEYLASWLRERLGCSDPHPVDQPR
jgi:hypothetical protein